MALPAWYSSQKPMTALTKSKVKISSSNQAQIPGSHVEECHAGRPLQGAALDAIDQQAQEQREGRVTDAGEGHDNGRAAQSPLMFLGHDAPHLPGAAQHQAHFRGDTLGWNERGHVHSARGIVHLPGILRMFPRPPMPWEKSPG